MIDASTYVFTRDGSELFVAYPLPYVSKWLLTLSIGVSLATSWNAIRALGSFLHS
jgi:hypothetical protein